jgi:Adenylosuccinate lyase
MAMSRYTHPVIDHAWSYSGKYPYWLRVEWAAATAAGDAETAVLLGEEIDGSDIKQILKYETITRHDVGAFVRWLREVRGATRAHWGLSSSDLVDAGQALAVLDVSQCLCREAQLLTRALELLGIQHAGTPRASRTHGVFAEPDTFGRQVGVWTDRIAKAALALDAATPGATELVLGGPIGAAEVHDSARLGALLGLSPGRWRKAQANDRLGLVAWMNSVAGLMGAIEHLALQIRLGATHGELAEHFASEQWGSTSMPHKRNPVRSERICGLARVVRAQVGALAESTSWWGEHDISHSSVERICVPLATGLTGFALREAIDIVAHLVVGHDRMAEHIEHAGTWDEWLAKQRADPDAWAEIYRELRDQ